MDKHKKIGYHPTWIEINLDALAHNLRQVKKLISSSAKILVCVKKNAYGHGLIPLSKRLVSEGIDYLGVASIDEGIALRKSGIDTPILILGMVLPCDVEPVIRYNLTQTLSSEELAMALQRKARAFRKKVKVHIKIDTGMGRIGILTKDALPFIKKIKKLPFLELEGIFTHFPIADSNAEFTRYQLTLFNQIITQMQKENIHIPLRHAANSMGVIGYKQSHFNMVRPGLMVYGLYPKSNLKVALQPVLTLKTKIIYLKIVPAGYGISYGHNYRTQKRTTIATLAVGYGDGYPRILSNKAEVLIRGKRFKISGTICMDKLMVDIKALKAKIGEEVVLIGAQGGKEKITAEEIAALAGTIPYEIVCSLGHHLPRIYLI
jgi:alanine racemase